MALYNCRHSGDQYRITKFDADMNPQGSYLVDDEACECPAGVRPTCRHREMLPKFLQRGHVGDEWMFDYDRGGWVQMGEEWAQPVETGSHLSGDPTDNIDWDTMAEERLGQRPKSAPTGATSLPEGESEPQVTAASVGAVYDMPPLPEGVTMIVMDSPDKVVEVHNAIAEAVGEPQMPPSTKHFQRRF
jgi:hypothetical protein